MKDHFAQPAFQPFVKLAQSNMELLTKFSSSPEVMSQSMATAQSLVQQGQESAMNLIRSNAFGHMAQGFIKNYTEFLMELGQSTMTVFTLGQAAMMRQAQDATTNVVDASTVAARRARQAA